MPDSQELSALESVVLDAARDAVADRGMKTLEYRFVQIGRSGTVTVIVDGQHRRRGGGSQFETLAEALEAHRETSRNGRRWSVATVTVTGEDVTVSFDYERPPPPWKVHFRVVGAYMSELELLPRPPSVVPGWMKVELAQVGAWDLVVDEPRWNQDFEPTGVPQSPGSVGMAPPEGAEWAIEQPLPHEDMDAMNRLAIRYAEEEERRTGVFPPELVAFRETWA